MPRKAQVVDIDRTIESLTVKGRLEILCPFYGGSSGKVEGKIDTLKATVIAGKIEHAINTVIADFKFDFGIPEDVPQPHAITPEMKVALLSQFVEALFDDHIVEIKGYPQYIGLPGGPHRRIGQHITVSYWSPRTPL